MENYNLPKNIRQIGGREERIRIYLEDYVNTYIHQFEQDTEQSVRGGVLLGEQVSMNGAKHLFIRGAIAVDDPLWKNKNGQDGLQEKIRLYFPNLDICGWFVCDNQDTVSELQLIKIFEEHFREDGQVLLRIQGADEDFYAQDSVEGFRALEGYYIYYERNDQMQEYMIAQQPPYPPERVDAVRSLDEEREPVENAVKKRLAARKAGTKERSRTLHKKSVRIGRHERRRQKRLDSRVQNSRAKKAGQQTAATQSPNRKHSKGKVGLADIVIRMGSLAAIFLLAFFIVTNQTKTSSQKLTSQNQKQTVQAKMVQANVETQVNSLEQANAEQTDTGESGSEQVSAEQTGNEQSNLEQTGIGQGNSVQSNVGEADSTNSSNNSTSQSNESESSSSESSGADRQASALVSGKGNSSATDITEQVTPNYISRSNSTDSSSTSSTSGNSEQEAGAEVPSLYTIVKGESLESISKKFYGSTDMVEQICAINGIQNSDYIQAGDEIRLP